MFSLGRDKGVNDLGSVKPGGSINKTSLTPSGVQDGQPRRNSIRSIRSRVSDSQATDGATTTGSHDLARRLKLGKTLGAGSYAVVFKALLDGQLVAAKVLRPELARKPSALKVFLREAEVLRTYKHKYVVDVYGVYQLPAGFGGLKTTRVTWVMIMEYLKAGPLTKFITQQMEKPATKVYTDVDAINWMIHIASALEFLHAQTPTIVHRDIKLENILMTTDDANPASNQLIAKLADFGLHVRLEPNFVSTLVRRRQASAEASNHGIFTLQRAPSNDGTNSSYASVSQLLHNLGLPSYRPGADPSVTAVPERVSSRRVSGEGTRTWTRTNSDSADPTAAGQAADGDPPMPNMSMEPDAVSLALRRRAISARASMPDDAAESYSLRPISRRSHSVAIVSSSGQGGTQLDGADVPRDSRESSPVHRSGSSTAPQMDAASPRQGQPLLALDPVSRAISTSRCSRALSCDGLTPLQEGPNEGTGNGGGSSSNHHYDFMRQSKTADDTPATAVATTVAAASADPDPGPSSSVTAPGPTPSSSPPVAYVAPFSRASLPLSPPTSSSPAPSSFPMGSAPRHPSASFSIRPRLPNSLRGPNVAERSARHRLSYSGPVPPFHMGASLAAGVTAGDGDSGGGLLPAPPRPSLMGHHSGPANISHLLRPQSGSASLPTIPATEPIVIPEASGQLLDQPLQPWRLQQRKSDTATSMSTAMAAVAASPGGIDASEVNPILAASHDNYSPGAVSPSSPRSPHSLTTPSAAYYHPVTHPQLPGMDPLQQHVPHGAGYPGSSNTQPPYRHVRESLTASMTETSGGGSASGGGHDPASTAAVVAATAHMHSGGGTGAVLPLGNSPVGRGGDSPYLHPLRLAEEEGLAGEDQARGPESREAITAPGLALDPPTPSGRASPGVIIAHEAPRQHSHISMASGARVRTVSVTQRSGHSMMMAVMHASQSARAVRGSDVGDANTAGPSGPTTLLSSAVLGGRSNSSIADRITPPSRLHSVNTTLRRSQTEGRPWLRPDIPEFERVYDLSGKTGTCIYMAPEIAKEEPYNEKADVFSFGIVMYEVFARTLIMKTALGKDVIALTRRLVAGERPRRPARIHPRLWHLIQACWHQDPLERPPMSLVLRQLVEIRALLEAEETQAEAAAGKVLCCSGGRCIVS